MSLPFRFYSSDEWTYSLYFEDRIPWDVKALKKYFHPILPNLEELTTTFNSLNFLLSSPLKSKEIESHLMHVDYKQFLRKPPLNCWEIPVCFDEQYTADLFNCLGREQQAVEQYIKGFLAVTFELEFYGFLPGFGYLSGLPETLILPRKKTPNRITKKGTLAIGGSQVGLYPQDSPGGWQGIGYCPIPLFTANKIPPFFIEVGDAIRFIAIDKMQCDAVTVSLKENQYTPKKIRL